MTDQSPQASGPLDGAEPHGSSPLQTGHGSSGQHPGGLAGGSADADHRGKSAQSSSQPGYAQPGFDPAGYGQAGFGQGGYGHPGNGQAGHGQPGYDPGGYPQPEYHQNGYGQPVYPQTSYPPAGYGQAEYGRPPYDQAGYGTAPRTEYASWGRRVAAFLLDQLPYIVGNVIFGIGYVAFIQSFIDNSTYGTGVVPTAGLTPMGIGSVITLAAFLWTSYNRWIVGGRTGQSWGKRVTNISLVSELTGQPIGALNAFLRDLVHILDSLPVYLGYLWPLWDEKKQTFSDKIMRTVVVDQARSPRS